MATFYEVYDGNNYVIMGEATLHKMYEVKGNTIDYPTFNGWVCEMIKLGIAREV